MKFNFDDKEIEIIIPKTVPRYKKEVLDFLYEHDVDWIVEQEKNGTYNKDENNIEHVPVKTIGIWMSGGADSSLLAYLLAKKIKEENLDVLLQPLSVRRIPKTWNVIYATNIVDFIKDQLKVDNILDLKSYWPSLDDDYQANFKEFVDRDHENFSKNLLQIMYSGITSNPPKGELDEESTQTNRDDGQGTILIKDDWPLRTYYNPFAKINKKTLAKIYDHLDLTETLFPMTRSCEGFEQDTKNYTVHCEKCWWCKERFWAFGRYV